MMNAHIKEEDLSGFTEHSQLDAGDFLDDPSGSMSELEYMAGCMATTRDFAELPYNGKTETEGPFHEGCGATREGSILNGTDASSSGISGGFAAGVASRAYTSSRQSNRSRFDRLSAHHPILEHSPSQSNSSTSSSPGTSGPSSATSGSSTPKRGRSGPFNQMCRVQRVVHNATEEDLKSIYLYYTRNRPIINVELPIWISDSPRVPQVQSPGPVPNTVARVVNNRIQQLLATDEVADFIAATRVDLDPVLKVLRLCLASDVQNPGQKEVNFPWLRE